MRLCKLVGDLGKIDKLARQIGPQRTKAFVSSLSEKLALEALALTREGFEQGKDPSGRGWRRLKDKRARGRKPLNRSGALKRSFQQVALSKSAKVFSNDPIAAYHQHGSRSKTDADAKGTPARTQLPGARLPLRWKERLSPIALQEFRRLIRGEL